MSNFYLRVEGEPIPWSVSKIYRHGQKKNPRLIAWQRLISLQAKLKHMGDPWIGAVLVRFITIRRTRPKSNKTKWPIVKPDLDNYIKAVWDALQGIIYVNDSQIVHYERGPRKVWATEIAPPGITLEIERMEEE